MLVNSDRILLKGGWRDSGVESKQVDSGGVGDAGITGGPGLKVVEGKVGKREHPESRYTYTTLHDCDGLLESPIPMQKCIPEI